MKLVQILKEIEMNRTWDLDVPGVDPEKIKVGDILTFTLFEPTVEKVKQRVTEKLATGSVKVVDLPGESGDFWNSHDLQYYYKTVERTKKEKGIS